MREFVACWHAPLTTQDGIPEDDVKLAERQLELPFPAALREWYALAGRRADLWSRQDQFLTPGDCYIADDVLVFYVENQCVVRWGIPLSNALDDDPRVVVESVDARGTWIIENSSTSEFALQMLVSAGKWSATIWGDGSADDAAVGVIVDNYAKLDFPDWHWPDFPTRTYGNDEILIETNGVGESTWLRTWSRSIDEFRQLDERLRQSGFEWHAWSETGGW